MQIKTLDLKSTKLKATDSGYRFSGYASVFGVKDSDGDIIEKGAYNLDEANPKMFFNHLHYDLPIGKWLTLSQDDYGLFVEGELTQGHSMAENVKAALNHETIDGMSVGFIMNKDDYEDTEDGRIIKNIPFLPEVSVVTFPANSASLITEVKSSIGKIKCVRDFERFLSESSNCSNAVAVALTAKMRSITQGELDELKQQSELLSSINQLSKTIKG